MTEISTARVEHLASLARIALTHDEVARMATELSAIVDAIAIVGEVADADVPPTSHPVPLKNGLRDDVPGPTLDADAVFRGAPSHEGDRFRVTAILGEEQ